MPDLPTLGLFLAATAALLLVPGPSVLFIVARTLEHGRRGGLVSMLGVETGALLHVLAATAGLSALVAASPGTLLAIKLGGAAYLLYMGVRALRRPPELALRRRPGAPPVPPRPRRRRPQPQDGDVLPRLPAPVHRPVRGLDRGPDARARPLLRRAGDALGRRLRAARGRGRRARATQPEGPRTARQAQWSGVCRAGNPDRRSRRLSGDAADAAPARARREVQPVLEEQLPLRASADVASARDRRRRRRPSRPPGGGPDDPGRRARIDAHGRDAGAPGRRDVERRGRSPTRARCAGARRRSPARRARPASAAASRRRRREGPSSAAANALAPQQRAALDRHRPRDRAGAPADRVLDVADHVRAGAQREQDRGGDDPEEEHPRHHARAAPAPSPAPPRGARCRPRAGRAGVQVAVGGVVTTGISAVSDSPAHPRAWPRTSARASPCRRACPRPARARTRPARSSHLHPPRRGRPRASVKSDRSSRYVSSDTSSHSSSGAKHHSSACRRSSIAPPTSSVGPRLEASRRGGSRAPPSGRRRTGPAAPRPSTCRAASSAPAPPRAGRPGRGARRRS